MGFQTTPAVLLTYDGHDINDGTNYRAWLDGDALNLPESQPLEADVDYDWAQYVGTEKGPRTFIVHIQIQERASWQERIDELNGWFNTQDGEEQYLLALWPQAMAVRRMQCRPVTSRVDGLWYHLTLKALRPYWEANEAESTVWEITSSGDTQAVTNPGNMRVPPVLKIKATEAPANAWRWLRPVSVRNAVNSKLTNYPLDLTGGGWNTAALVANASTTTTLTSGIDADDTPIAVPDTSAFYSAGLIYINNEQIYYSGKTATSFTGCVRGVGGTTAAVHSGGATVYQSECFADGRDIRVELDGVEIPRWFGAAAKTEFGPNTTSTMVWAVIPQLPALGTTFWSGELVTLGDDLAIDHSVTASSETSGYPGEQAVDGNTGTFWKAAPGITAANVVIDLGAQMLINRVRLRHPDTAEAPKTFTVQTSANGSDWTTQVTVAANTIASGYTVHEFAPVTCRYVKLDITAVQTGGGGLAVREIEVYCVHYRLSIKYGNPLVAAYSGSDDTKPMFALATSNNDTWDFDDFYDVLHAGRAASWVPIQYQSTQAMRVYDPLTGGLAASLGIAEKESSTTTFRDGYRFDNPCGITAVTHSGAARQTSSYRRMRLLGLFASGNPVVEFESMINSPSSWTSWGPTLTTLSNTAIAVIFYDWIKASSTAYNRVGVTDVTLAIDAPPTVTLQEATYAPFATQIAGQIYNQTTGESIFVTGTVKSDVNLIVDVENFDVYLEDSNQRQPSIISLEAGAVRDRWMYLAVGANTLEYIEQGVAGVEIDVELRARYL